ncbi:uncharacterized protein KY384_007265 [Bacidia gigantensis]|uniref:uncharacterized protein n=1 Tax=Bacidia gigantensis TaxID=2732470 RepID=UPI001D045E1C|nr:uncharacterized protein KY384_007265 [Bacidia gigantensis]KAG8528347.1 hypothetical protein KY384_007265 [Bacidia gigantensis]
MSFLDHLPNELLAQIALELHPADLINLVSTSKHVREASTPALKVFRNTGKDWESMNTKCFTESKLSISNVLTDSLLRPHVGFFVQVLWLQKWAPADKESYKAYHGRYVGLFQSAYRDTRLSERSVCNTEAHSESWVDGIESGDETFVIAILLLYLPNLSLLKWHVTDDADEWHDSTKLLTLIRSLKDSHGAMLLPKLREVYLIGGRLERDSIGDNLPPEYIPTFMSFPSVQSLKIYGFESNAPKGAMSKLERSNLSTLKITGQLYENHGSYDWMEQILIATPALKTLTLKAVTRGDEMLGIVSMLLVRHVQHTLEELTFASYSHFSVGGLGNLSELTRLRYLRTEFVGMGERWLDPDPCISHLLPVSIEHLELYDNDIWHPGLCLTCMLDLVGKKSIFPNLTRVALYMNTLYQNREHLGAGVKELIAKGHAADISVRVETVDDGAIIPCC